MTDSNSSNFTLGKEIDISKLSYAEAVEIVGRPVADILFKAEIGKTPVDAVKVIGVDTKNRIVKLGRR